MQCDSNGTKDEQPKTDWAMQRSKVDKKTEKDNCIQANHMFLLLILSVVWSVQGNHAHTNVNRIDNDVD